MNWTLIIVILFIVAIVLVAAVLIMALARTQEKNRRKAFAIEINNQGNATTRYELWADDPAHVLKFEFLLNGAVMGQSAQTVGQNLLATPPGRPSSRGQNTYTMTAPKPGPLAAVANGVAGVADTLGHLLPGSAGYSILAVSERIRMGQNTVERTQRTAGSVERYSGKVGKLNQQAKSGANSGSASATGAMAGPNSSQPATVMSAAGGGTTERPQTPVVEPGKGLKLDLVVKPVTRLKVNKVSFAILSRSLDQPDAEPQSEAGAVVFPGMTGIAFYLPYVVIGATALIMIVVIVAVTHVLG